MTSSGQPPASPRLARQIFGQLPAGMPGEMVTLRGDRGFEVRVITFGAAIQSLFVPDRNGRLADVVLGRDDLAGYVAERRFLGATIGRYANRIAGGRFELEGRHYQITLNDGANSLHGGLEGFDRKNWTVAAAGEEPSPFVTLSYQSADGEQGFPGALQASITYRISGGTELSLEFSAVCDQPTIVNLTNHSFFNLGGVETLGGIRDHQLTIAAERYLPVAADGIPLGAPAMVDGTPFDFRSPHAVGARLQDPDPQIRLRSGYDHCYCLDGGAMAEPRFAARVEDPSSGRALELWTNQPGLQFYSGNFLDGSITGKYHQVHRQYDALCLEPQTWPDAPNHPDYPSARLDPGQIYRHVSRYRFSAA